MDSKVVSLPAPKSYLQSLMLLLRNLLPNISWTPKSKITTFCYLLVQRITAVSHALGVAYPEKYYEDDNLKDRIFYIKEVTL